MITEKQYQDLKNQYSKLESQKIDLLSHNDFDSVTSAIETYLPTIKLIGNQKAKGKKLFSTKLIKKIEKQLSKLFHAYCDFEGERNWQTWCEGDCQLIHQTAIGLIKQQQAIIESAVMIYSEDYLKCSYTKLKTMFAAESMIKDILKAADYLSNAWCYSIINKQMNVVAA